MAIKFSKKKSDETPYNNFTYVVEVDGTQICGFSHVTGIGVQADVLEYQEGGRHDVTHKFPQKTRYSTVSLHRGVTAHDDFATWITRSVTNPKKNAQFDVVVTMKNRKGKTSKGWKFRGAHPVRWEGPELTAESSGFALELLELSYQKLEFIS